MTADKNSRKRRQRKGKEDAGNGKASLQIRKQQAKK